MKSLVLFEISSRSFSFRPNIVPEDVSFDEPIAFSWWLLKEIAPLYKYDVSGKLVHKEGVMCFLDSFDYIIV